MENQASNGSILYYIFNSRNFEKIKTYFKFIKMIKNVFKINASKII